MTEPASTEAAEKAGLRLQPMIGLGAVLFGTFISTLSGRLSSLGLADIRGALGLGFDEAAWIGTALTSGQMMVAPLAVWAALVLGPRRVLLAGCVIFASASALTPLSHGIRPLLALQFVAGLGSGCFVPLAILLVLRSMPPRYWVVGIALYALNIETSLNISASVEGFYVDHLSWAWIYGQNVPLAAAMALCVHFGIPAQPVDRAAARQADVFGMASAALGFSLLYAALDQGNRLDWLNSGQVVGLLVGGGVLVLLFIGHEASTPRPWIDLRMLTVGYLPLLLLLVCEVRFAALGTGYLVPQFLVAVRGFRPPEIGDVLVWIALPQIVAAPLAVLLLRRIDSRWVALFGLSLIATACWITATHLTGDWATRDFLATQLLQAVGQTCAISAAIFTGVLNLKPAQMATFGVSIQIARLFGAELGLAFITTFVRVREQAVSQTIGTHIATGALDTTARLQGLAAGLSRHGDPANAGARAAAVLALDVRGQANLQACIEGFAVLAASTAVAFLLLLFEPPPQGPASPRGPLARIRWSRA